MEKIAQTPPRGWNSWDAYGAAVTETEIRQNAVYMAKHLKRFGWEYVVVDIQWYEATADSSVYHDFAPLTMDQFSRLHPAENRFPSAADGKGFKKLADFVHNLGLKFGIHIMRGIPREAVHKNFSVKGTDKKAGDIALNNVCPWNADMYGVNMEIPEGQLYYDSLFDLYAEWGVDFVKVDDIADSKIYHSAHHNEIEGIRKAIDHCGRPIVLSLSPGPAHLGDGAFLQKNANMWRLTDDFWDTWPQLCQMFKKCEEWAPFIQPGSWPDCDMLPLGHIGIRSVDGGGSDRQSRFTKAEQKTMMTLWTIFQSPLMFGGELTELDEETLKLLTNEEVINMHDTLHFQRQIYRDEEWIIWEGSSEESIYKGIFYLGEEEAGLPFRLQKNFIHPESYNELWTGTEFSAENHTFSAHDCVLLKTVV